ncbi:MAG: glycosyltransferase [Marmoricola sp.]
MRRTRVVHVSSAHPATDPRIFEKECRTLAAAGFDVHLVATGVAPSDASGVKVTIVGRPTGRASRMTLGSFRAVIAALRSRASIVHLHDPELALWIPLLRLLRRQVVFDSHEDIVATVSTKDYLPPLVRRAATVMSRALVLLIDRLATAVVSATPSISKNFNNPRAAVIQNFPVLAEFATKSSREAVRLLYIGNLTEARGARQMVDAMEAVATEEPVATLTIAGRISAGLLEDLRALPGWRHVDYRGLLDRDGVNALLAEADIGLVLFQPEPNHIESQPTKMFEYMIAGLALVASDFPLWRALVTDEQLGRVVDPTDAGAIARVIVSLMRDPAEVRAMGERARKVVAARHSWEREGAALVDLYSALASSR